MKTREQALDPKRIADDLWRLVDIASPTGHERKAALAYAEMLARSGADVTLDETLPESPTVIGRLRGRRPGRVFQLAGHIDHIDMPHAAPERQGSVISGRGSADMKGGLAGILEIVRVLKAGGCDFAGEILVTVYGLHEAPVGRSEGLLKLINDGVKGEVALVAETVHSARHQAVVTGKGQAIWTLTLRRRGKICHELNRSPESDGLLVALLSVLQALCAFNEALAKAKNPDRELGADSLFVGQIHYGDFYNRMPSQCRLQGTRRWSPGRDFAEIQAEFSDQLQKGTCPDGITLEPDWILVGEAYQMTADEPVIKAYQKAYRHVTGRECALGGIAAITDAHRLIPLGHVPTVLCGFDNEQAHAEHECVRLEQVHEGCKIALATVLNYLEADPA